MLGLGDVLEIQFIRRQGGNEKERMEGRGDVGVDVGDNEGHLYVFYPSLGTAQSTEEYKYWHSKDANGEVIRDIHTRMKVGSKGSWSEPTPCQWHWNCPSKC